MPRIFSSFCWIRKSNETLPVGHRSVGVGATYHYYDHHMERTGLRLVPGEFERGPPARLLGPPLTSFVKPDFREEVRLGLDFSRRLVVWHFSKGGRPLIKSVHSGCGC